MFPAQACMPTLMPRVFPPSSRTARPLLADLILFVRFGAIVTIRNPRKIVLVIVKALYYLCAKWWWCGECQWRGGRAQMYQGCQARGLLSSFGTRRASWNRAKGYPRIKKNRYIHLRIWACIGIQAPLDSTSLHEVS